jgi:hypothetical protein
LALITYRFLGSWMRADTCYFLAAAFGPTAQFGLLCLAHSLTHAHTRSHVHSRIHTHAHTHAHTQAHTHFFLYLVQASAVHTKGRTGLDTPSKRKFRKFKLPPPVLIEGPSFFSFHHVNAYEVCVCTCVHAFVCSIPVYTRCLFVPYDCGCTFTA